TLCAGDRRGPQGAADRRTWRRSRAAGRHVPASKAPNRRTQVQRASANPQKEDCPECALPAQPAAETGRARPHLQLPGRRPASPKNPRRARRKRRRSRNTRNATDRNWCDCASSWLPANGNVGLGLHQPLPFADILAHEKLVGGRPFDRPVFERLDTPRYAEAAVHVDPLVFDATKAPLDLLEIRDVIDLAEV